MIDVEAPDHNQVLGAGWVMVKGCFLGKKKTQHVKSPEPRECFWSCLWFHLQVRSHQMEMQVARKDLTGPDPEDSRRMWKHLKQDERPAIKGYVVLALYQVPS